jgi:hypothetical protein
MLRENALLLKRPWRGRAAADCTRNLELAVAPLYLATQVVQCADVLKSFLVLLFK